MSMHDHTAQPDNGSGATHNASTPAAADNLSAPQMDPNPIDDVPQPPAERSAEDLELAGKVEECLLDVIDPELGINVVDLGLVYDTWIEGTTAVVNMTLTSPACPLTDMIEDQANSAVLGTLQEIAELQINWVWTPPWGPHMINEQGREQLRYLGFSV